MNKLTPLASALHSKVWPFVAHKATVYCETIDAENDYMNEAVARYAPLIAATDVEVLGLIWGVHPTEAARWRDDMLAAIKEYA